MSALKNVATVAKHVPGISFPKRTPFVPVIPDWPVIPESILKIAALAEAKGKFQDHFLKMKQIYPYYNKKYF